MSKNRQELRSALRSFGVSKPLHIPREIGFKTPIAMPEPPAAADPIPRVLAERGSKPDPVQNEQSPNQTPFKMNSVQVEPGQREITEDSGSRGSVRTGSKMDTVQPELCEKRTGSKLDPVATFSGPFTRVPNSLLRNETPFDDPLDFMIYLHLFTYSHGFGRSVVSMGLAQLERFTKSGRNTVKRSLDRLKAKGLVECIEEYEHSRMSRKWKVYLPAGTSSNGPGAGGDLTGSKMNPVQNGSCPEWTPRVSKMNAVTGSKMDTYKERVPKEKSKNALSRAGAHEGERGGQPVVEEPGNLSIRDYFAAGRHAPRKQASELQAYRELRADFSDEAIALCLDYVSRKGVPGTGEPCHSPMAFLATAITSVIPFAEAEHRKSEEQNHRLELERSEASRKIEEAATEEDAYRRKEAAFVAKYPDPGDQARQILALAGDLRSFLKDPAVLRRAVVGSLAL